MFNSNNFSEINYLNFDSNFDITLLDKIKIILGPNGTGKTSIYKNIRKRYLDYAFIDYKEVEQSVVAKKDEIIIGASIVLLENKIKEKEQLLEEINVKNNLKDMSITNKATAEAISKNMETLRKSPEQAILDFSNGKLECIFSLNEDYKNFFKSNASKLMGLQEVKTELKDLKDNYKKHFLEEIDNYLDNDDHVCPVCGKNNDEPIKIIIARKLLEIKEIEEEIVRNYQSIHLDFKPETILKNLNDIKNVISENNLSISDVESYFICGGIREKSNLIVESKEKLKEINNDIKNLESQKDEFYKNLKKYSDDLISIFHFQFSVDRSNIIFDDENKLIKIKLPRKVEEYSTGEVNLITFITCVLEFISSDKKCLIIDDPLSSYDIPNQYKIMYEIAAAKSDLKSILIFTHNVDTINIANTQFNKLFEYEVLEKRKNTLFLNKIGYCTQNNVLDVTELLNNLNKTYKHYHYLELLTKKETWDDTNEDHLIFHYDEPFNKTIDGFNYTNDYISDLIDNFDENTFQNSSYLENTANKIIYAAALRVWIEKQFYVVSNNDSSLHEKQFGDKIKYIFNDNRWRGSNKVTREYLMSKKVMLNQHIHQKSQIMPFYYSLNLTFDDISNEINDIKEHFN